MIAAKRATTIKDLALALGVSTATVSQALRPNPRSNIKLPEETVARVRAAAAGMHYRAHAGARSIRSRVFRNLGFFTAKKGRAHSPDGLLGGAHDAAEEAGYRITQIRLPEQVEEISGRLPSILNERNLDGLLIGSYHPISARIQAQLGGDNVPVVYLNDRHEKNAVYVEDREGAREMTQYLVERGYRRICFVLRKAPDDPPLERMHHSAKERLEGYWEAMREAGLKAAEQTVRAAEVVEAEHRFPRNWRSWVERYDALLAYDDDLANQIGRRLYQHGIRVPEDIGLAGYNGDYGSLCAWQEMTTMRIPFYEMGRLGFGLARELVESGNVEARPSRAVRAQLIVGRTTR